MFTSQTDTEVIAKLIEEYYELNGDENLKRAVEKALAQCAMAVGDCA